jgi:hypothetical protein
LPFEVFVAKKIKISNGDLTAIVYEEIKQAPDCPMGIHVAIVPAERSGWRVLMSPAQRKKYLACVKRVEAIEKQLRAVYDLVRD